MARWPSLPNERGAIRWGFRSRFISFKLLFLHFDTLRTYFLPFVSLFEISFDLYCSLFFIFSVNGFADHYIAIPNFSLINQPSLEKILQVEVFVHKDG